MYHESINFFEGDYAFLSNFYSSPFTNTENDLPDLINLALDYPWNKGQWPTVEHYYQASKMRDTAKQALIHNAATPGKAKRLGATVELRPEWEQVKYGVMLRALWYKFSQDILLAKRLKDTERAYLLEGNQWHDNEWGHCFCGRCRNKPGKNLLGRALMEVRGVI